MTMITKIERESGRMHNQYQGAVTKATWSGWGKAVRGFDRRNTSPNDSATKRCRVAQ